MGKPFKKEIEIIPRTIKWAYNQQVETLSTFFYDNPDTPLFIVGSGGSLSACYFAAYLYQKTGIMAKAITPLELYYSKEALRNSKILFISSSGKNTDILFSFDFAIKQEPKSIFALCMKRNTPLSKIANEYSVSKSMEFDIPSKKDGFLATNTLVAYYTILSKAFGYDSYLVGDKIVDEKFLFQVNEFVSKLSLNHSITVLYGGWGQSIAYDIESKFTEAALGCTLLSDYRNFGHGRHHWFAKRKRTSSIVALVTPEEKQIAEKTLALVPAEIPKLFIESEQISVKSSIELLVKSFQLVNSFGRSQDIDPGRPGVPSFGKKLYHMKYSSLYKIPETNNLFIDKLHITRKVDVSSFEKLSEEEKCYWSNKYNDFIKRLRNTNYGIVIFDYDGTICSTENRFKGVSIEIRNELIRLLRQKIVIGIATGRGKSVREDFIQWVPKNLWGNIIIGYYNGSVIGSLIDLKAPNKNLKSHKILSQINNTLLENKLLTPIIESELRPNQITVKFKSKENNERIRGLLRSIISKPIYKQTEILESSHSIDIIFRTKVSKLNIIKDCVKRAADNSKSLDYLCIGDRGKWPGNDFELLLSSYSLSVDEVSNDPDSCWNLASLGNKNSKAALEYLKRMVIVNGNIKFI